MQFRSHYILVLLFSILISPLNLPASDANLDFTNSVIVTSRKLEKLEQKALTVLREEIQKRTGIQLNTVTRWPGNKQPVIAIGQKEQIKFFAGPYSDIFENGQTPNKEGFQLLIKGNAILVVGNDPRGVFYGVGRLLRDLYMKTGSIIAPKKIDITTSPRYAIRGHQLGYRPKTNAYDAWDPAQFDQYIRELGIFGANCIEIIPPRSDDTLTSPHMKLAPIEMMIKQAEIIDSYGMDVWIWYPNIGEDYTHTDAIREELEEREEIFKKLKRIDVVFVPGGDPGDLHPDILFVWLEKVAKVLNKYHPKAKIWVSPQAFRPTKKWLDAFYNNVNLRFPWFGGVVFGPWIKTPLPEIRKIVDPKIPIRRYPDITHSISCQYPVKDWDLSFAMTLGRECYNPRPAAEKVIHNALDEFASGSISYSEGINDDVNKFIWSGQDWNPETPVIETLREYSRLFIHPDFSEDIAQGILAQEENWQGPLIANNSVEVTLNQWKNMEKQFPREVVKNYRFQMGLLRAYYDAYTRERLIHETALESEARGILRNVTIINSQEKMEQAESILNQKWEKPVAQDYKERCWEIADYLFEIIGSQTSVKKHKAKPGRGDFMDYIDTPLNNAIWLLSQFERIRKITDEQARLASLDALLNRSNPGLGGFYDNLGKSINTPRLGDYPVWEEDPGSLRSPRVSFGAGLKGREWIHTVQARGFDGSAIPLEWMNQITTLYETPLNVVYENLDPHSSYILKVAYTGRFQSKIQLTADDKFQIHEMIKTGKTPVNKFPVPKEATMDSKLKLTWTCSEGERGAQVAEIWLIPVKK
ncbi:MAG: hypothetical protein H8D56_13070 [Planctomycetes bacterium]|nr:hypothetical protein [Planctomycetota bacterium]MBL7145863.1 hypothetical protein [Phycisphaerae bacterium]